MKNSLPTASRIAPDSAHLQVERVEAVSADHLVFEIAADGAGAREARDIRARFLGIDRISALEIHRQRKLDRIDDPLCIGQGKIDRHLLAVGPAVGVGHGVATGRERLGPGRDHRQSAADVPDVVEDDRVARYVKRDESLVFACHSARLSRRGAARNRWSLPRRCFIGAPCPMFAPTHWHCSKALARPR